MRYGTVCSGVEAFGPAWEAMGYECAFHAEIAAHPAAVLRYHYPTIPNYGDFTTIEASDATRIDVLCGGTPCQDFSVAGLRKGLAGKRGSLTLEFAGLAERLRPRWLVWENVPGVLSADGGRAFGQFLSLLAELGYYATYRVLDAQHFGVPQRRRRVFLVGYLGDWRPAAAVLLESESLRRHPAPSRNAWQNIAPTLTRRAGDSNDRDASTLVSQQGAGLLQGSAVRRLTPLECERLMGYPANWTRWGTYKNGHTKRIADGPRYQMCGNGWATPVANWVAERVMLIEKLLNS